MIEPNVITERDFRGQKQKYLGGPKSGLPLKIFSHFNAFPLEIDGRNSRLTYVVRPDAIIIHDTERPQFHFEARAQYGTMTLDIRTRVDYENSTSEQHPDINAKLLFHHSFRQFRERGLIQSIRAKWSDESDNYSQFQAAGADQYAALSTWTGKRAHEVGFLHAQVLPEMETDEFGDVIYVIFRPLYGEIERLCHEYGINPDELSNRTRSDLRTRSA